MAVEIPALWLVEIGPLHDWFVMPMDIQIIYSLAKNHEIKYSQIQAGIRYLEKLSNCAHPRTPATLREFLKFTGSVRFLGSTYVQATMFIINFIVC